MMRKGKLTPIAGIAIVVVLGFVVYFSICFDCSLPPEPNTLRFAENSDRSAYSEISKTECLSLRSEGWDVDWAPIGSTGECITWAIMEPEMFIWVVVMDNAEPVRYCTHNYYEHVDEVNARGCRTTLGPRPVI